MARTADPKRRPAIIAAAVEHFAEVGFAAARVSDIAEKAKVGKGTVYQYFATKEDLLVEAVMHHCLSARAQVDLAMGSAGGWSLAMPTSGSGNNRLAEPDRALYRLVSTVLDVIPAAGQPQVKLFVDLWTVSREQPAVLVKAQARLAELYAQWEALVGYLIMAGQATGRFRPQIDGRTVARWFTATADGLVWQMSFRPEAPSAAQAIAETLLAGLLIDPARLQDLRS